MNTSTQNVVLHLDPDALVILPDAESLPGVRHDLIDGHNTVALGDLSRHIVRMAEERAERLRLAGIAAHPASAYTDSTTAPLPGKVERGTNPTTDLLARVHAWETDDSIPHDAAYDLLRDAVQVIRTVAVDTLRVAAEAVFDTGMDAHVARWLEARAAVLELGKDASDPDIMDAAVAETTRAAAARLKLVDGDA